MDKKRRMQSLRKLHDPSFMLGRKALIAKCLCRIAQMRPLPPPFPSRLSQRNLSRLEQILQMEMMLAKFSAVVASGDTKNVLRRCRRMEPTFHCGLHGFK